MGYFSFDCVECGHPMLSSHASNRINDWMTQVVVVDRDGNVYKGEYDGYGRLPSGEFDQDLLASHDLWDEEMDTPVHAWRHEACWLVAGKPGFTKASTYSEDQGYFFPEGAHEMTEPKGGP